MFDFIKYDEIDSIGIADPTSRMATMPDRQAHRSR